MKATWHDFFGENCNRDAAVEPFVSFHRIEGIAFPSEFVHSELFDDNVFEEIVRREGEDMIGRYGRGGQRLTP